MLKAKITNNKTKIQLVPLHDHRGNPYERALQTWKNHFIANIAGADPQCPLHLWCRFICQSTITLNLLQPSNVNPNILAYKYLEGTFDFNATPLPHSEPKLLYTKKRPQEQHGTLTAKTDGTQA